MFQCSYDSLLVLLVSFWHHMWISFSNYDYQSVWKSVDLMKVANVCMYCLYVLVCQFFLWRGPGPSAAHYCLYHGTFVPRENYIRRLCGRMFAVLLYRDTWGRLLAEICVDKLSVCVWGWAGGCVCVCVWGVCVRMGVCMWVFVCGVFVCGCVCVCMCGGVCVVCVCEGVCVCVCEGGCVCVGGLVCRYPASFRTFSSHLMLRDQYFWEVVSGLLPGSLVWRRRCNLCFKGLCFGQHTGNAHGSFVVFLVPTGKSGRVIRLVHSFLPLKITLNYWLRIIRT